MPSRNDVEIEAAPTPDIYRYAEARIYRGEGRQAQDAFRLPLPTSDDRA